MLNPAPQLGALFWELLGTLEGGASVEEADLCGVDLGVYCLLLHPDSVSAFYLLRCELSSMAHTSSHDALC